MNEIPLGSIATVNEHQQIVARVGAFTEYETQLALLEKQAEGGLIFDCSDAKQDKAAREWRRELVTMRTGVEQARKDSTRTLDIIKSAFIDSQRAIERRIAPLEEMADLPIKAEEKRKADIKAAAELKEQERKELIELNINLMRIYLNMSNPNRESTAIRESIAELKAFEVTQTMFQEAHSRALSVKSETLELLNTQLEIAIEREEQAKKQAEIAEENARLRVQAEETARLQAIKDEAAAAKQAEADRIIQAERDRIAAENAEALRLANERIAAQEREANEAAERERQAQARIEEQERQIESARLADELRERERVATQRPVTNQEELKIDDPEPGFSAEASFSQIVELCDQKPAAKLLTEIKQVAQSAIAFLSEVK